MKNIAMAFMVLLFSILIFATPIWWKVTVWNECRENGSSFMYCVSMISVR